MYTVLASNDARCVKSDSVLITVLSNPSVVLPGDTAVCQGTSFLIASTSTAATSYSWQPVNGLSNPASPTPSVNPNTTTLYKIVAFNGVCLATDSILISVKPSPIVTVSNDTTVCATASIQLIANGATKYQWLSEPSLSSTDIPNPVATPTITTTYKVSGIGSNGCRKSDSVRVVVAPKPVFGVEPAIQTICIEDSATLKATGGDAYTWTPVAQIASPVNDIIKVSPSVATTYKVIIENSLCNLTDSATAVINVKARPALSVNKSNDIDCSNTTSRLTVTGGSVFRWSPSESLSSSSVYNPVASPSKTTTYRVVSRSLNGCFTEDSITVKVSNSTANSFYIASAFTPNGDGKNDCFGVKNLGNAKSLSLSIFNRWGEKVFFTDNPMVCWNGSFKGVNQDTGVFVYYLEAKTFCGDVNKKGTITLIR
jgi:gliding motility-associated-like protein